jgi:hypothetical protein
MRNNVEKARWAQAAVWHFTALSNGPHDDALFHLLVGLRHYAHEKLGYSTLDFDGAVMGSKARFYDDHGLNCIGGPKEK